MEYGYVLTVKKKIILLQEKLKIFLSGVERNRIYKWKNVYESLHPVCDGTSWSVSIITKDKNYLFEGSNKYPKEWSKFCKDIGLLIDEEFS